MRTRLSSIVVSSLVLLVFAACGGSGGGNGGGSGADAGGECSEGQTTCDGNSYLTCNGGNWEVSEQCPIMCNAVKGCVECQPGYNYCSEDAVYGCSDEGEQTGLVEACSGGLHCSGGSCVDMCVEAETNRSYTGCEYWPVDLDNAIEVFPTPPQDFFGCSLASPDAEVRSDLFVCSNSDDSQLAGLCDVPGNTCPGGYSCKQTDACVLDAKSSPFAIVVSNPQVFAVNVTLETQGGVASTYEVGAGQVQTIYPQMMLADRSVDRSGISKTAYLLTSDAPIIAYQFNPLDNEGVFSNDGSLLVPRHAFDTRYYAMTWPTLNRRDQAGASTHDYNGYITVVAWSNGTQVEITPSADVRASDGFAAIAAGQTATFDLDAFDVLNLEAASGGDLTGTLVNVVNPAQTVGVLAGHEATVIPNAGGDCCADHLEEMMFPTSTWGTQYAVARSQSRGMGEADVLRILAQENGTTVTVSPAPASGSCGSLNAGAFCEVNIMNDTVVTADKPILVGHYLKSVMTSDFFGETMGTGDPAMALAVPTEQFRESYTFLVPEEYDEQYISVVAPEGSSVKLDGEAIDGNLTGFGSTWTGGRIPVTPGQHTLTCPDGCGLEIYGYSDAVSYLFAGGLDLEQIVVD